jgi:hypothetical protein
VATPRKNNRLHVADPKAHLAALNQLERSVAVATDEELEALLEGLPEDHRAEVDRLCAAFPADTPVASLREAVKKGRVNGQAEALVLVLTDATLKDTIEQLGDKADLPSHDDLKEVLPGIIERHGLAATRMMIASAIAGDAPAKVTLQDLLKHDEELALPKAPAAEPEPKAAAAPLSAEEQAERDRLKAQRAERKAKQKAEAAARRQQSAAAKRR